MDTPCYSSSWVQSSRLWVSPIACIVDHFHLNYPTKTAVAARFGIGKDFWINVVLTICGYIPGMPILPWIAHYSFTAVLFRSRSQLLHPGEYSVVPIEFLFSLYCKNIRNNKTHARTPKWVQNFGLVDVSEIKRKERKSRWSNRYNDRLPHSTLEGQPLEEGQEGRGSSVDLSTENGPQNRADGELWGSEDEQYYNPERKAGSSSGRWQYPTNFKDVEPIEPPKRTKKKEKKNRWERTNDAYSMTGEGSTKKRKKKKKKDAETMSIATTESGETFPEAAEGGLYRERPLANDPSSNKKDKTTDEVVFNHEF